MNVRKTTATTVSLLVLIAGLHFLFQWVLHRGSNEALVRIIYRISSIASIGNFNVFLLKASFWTVLFINILDTILNNKVVFGVFNAVYIPVFMGGVLIGGVSIPIETHLFIILVYIVAISAVYWSFQKLIKNNHLGGQSLVAFLKEGYNGIKTASGHISDRHVVFHSSVILIALMAILIVSFIVYLTKIVF